MHANLDLGSDCRPGSTTRRRVTRNGLRAHLIHPADLCGADAGYGVCVGTPCRGRDNCTLGNLPPSFRQCGLVDRSAHCDPRWDRCVCWCNAPLIDLHRSSEATGKHPSLYSWALRACTLPLRPSACAASWPPWPQVPRSTRTHRRVYRCNRWWRLGASDNADTACRWAACTESRDRHGQRE